MTAAPQVIQLTCPNCRSQMRAQVFTLVDVGSQPELKNYLLSGQLNVAVCPNCDTPAMIAAPLIYHDPAKQLFLVHFPQQLNAGPQEQEQFIGEATSFLMRSLPADAPKGYLLAPKRFFTVNSLIDTVLEADGISREMLDAQRARVDLISRLLQAFQAGDEQLSSMVNQNKEAFNEELFATLNAFASASAQAGRPQDAQVLIELRARLVELTGFEDTEGPLEGAEEFEPEISYDQLIDQLMLLDEQQLQGAIEEILHVIDYSFYEAWSKRIEEAEQSGDTALAERLDQRRALILNMVESMEEESQRILQDATNLLQAALDAEDATALLRERRTEINEAFLFVIEANINAAQRSGADDMVANLERVRNLAVEVTQEALSPEERFMAELLSAETQQDATKLLRKNFAMIKPDFIKMLNEQAEQFETEGRTEPSARLRQLAREANAMLF